MQPLCQEGGRIHFALRWGCIEIAKTGGGGIRSALNGWEARKSPGMPGTPGSPPPRGRMAFTLPNGNTIMSHPANSGGEHKERITDMVKGKKHMSPVDRAEIEAGLRAGKSLKLIARETGRSTSTVSREVAKHAYASDKGTQLRPNQCVHRQDCEVTGLCKNSQCRGVRCAICGFNRCNALCDKCERIGCEKRLVRPGKVCNGCPDEKRCHVRKYFYIASRAQEDYGTLLSGARQGADLAEGERERLDAIISPAIRAGQSMHHVCVSRPGAFNRNERTLSRYLHRGLFSAKRGDMKRSCMVRPRKAGPGDYAHKVEQGCYVGRDYRAYQAYCREHPEKSVVFMDLVIGRVGGKCLMTLHWPATAFMIAILIAGKCAENVAAAFDDLHKNLGHELFSRLFAVVLTDRGSEFSNPSGQTECVLGRPNAYLAERVAFNLPQVAFTLSGHRARSYS